MRSPIALFAYNRPEHFARVALALAANQEARESALFVFSDAPKGNGDEQGVAAVRAFAHKLKGFATVEVIEQQSNRGVAGSITAGVARLTGEFGRAIVLEDDLLPSPHFLRYMNQALDTYERDERVISVHGYCYPVASPLPSTFFLRGADCWGWATWKRGWDLFEPDGRRLLHDLEHRDLLREFDFGGAYPYSRMLRDSIEGRNDSWAIRWYASAFLHGKLTLYPGSSQVQNVGADGTGVHVGSTGRFQHRDWGAEVVVGNIAVEESSVAWRAFAGYLASLRPSMTGKVIRGLSRLFVK